MADQTQKIDGILYGAKDTAGDGSRYSREVHVTGGNVTLEAADIEIGAVEIKDAATATRATVDGDGLEVHIDKAYTAPTHTAVNVTTNTGEVLASNANRLYALLVNDSDTTIYIKLGAAAVVNEGIRLNALGGNYEMSAMLGNLYTGAINGIHGGAGNKVLLVTEGV